MTTDTTIRPAWRPVIFALLAYVLFDLGLPLIHVPPHRLSLGIVALLVLVPTMIFMLLQLWLSRALVGLHTQPGLCAALTLLWIVCWFLTITQFGHLLVLAHILPHHRLTLPQMLLLSVQQLLLGLFITLACTFFGIALSRIVREANILLPVALIAMPIDYLGAMTKIGFTQNVVTKHPEIVRAVSVPVPTVGGLQPISFIGPGDALFMAFFFAVVLRLGLNDRGTFWWMYGLLTIAMLLVLVLPHFAVAALVPMGLAVLIANFRAFRLQRSEVFAVAYAGLLVLVLVVGFYLYSHVHFFRH